MAYSYGQLKELWVYAGGSADKADMAAAVATAESGGRPKIVSPAGAIGLWQIMPFNAHGADLRDPVANARRAVEMSGNGVNWRPWDVMWDPPERARSSAATYLSPNAPAMRVLKSHGGGTGLPTAGGIVDKAKDTAGTIASGAVEPVAQAIETARDDFLKFATSALFVLLGLGLVAMGAWRAAQPRIQAAQDRAAELGGKVMKGAVA